MGSKIHWAVAMTLVLKIIFKISSFVFILNLSEQDFSSGQDGITGTRFTLMLYTKNVGFEQGDFYNLFTTLKEFSDPSPQKRNKKYQD